MKQVFLIIIIFICLASACQPVRVPRHDFKWVPYETLSDRLSSEQKEIMESIGTPQAVWLKPFGIVMWVYCRRGVPNNHYNFDGNGLFLGKGKVGDRQLCQKPPPELREGIGAD